MPAEWTVRTTFFILRCSGAATLAYLAAGWLGLPHPVWATISALIFSQERLVETRSSIASNIEGTLIGLCVAVAVSRGAVLAGAGVTVEIAVGVGICALVAHLSPRLRMCMWTSPIVFLTAEPAIPTFLTAVYRGSEVIVGALLAGGLHWAAEAILVRLAKSSPRKEPTL